jgi:futalosine hydrolase
LTKQLQNKKYKLVINAGIAGSFNDEISVGSTVMVTSDCFADLGVMDNGSFRTIFDEKFQDPNAFPFHNGKLLCTFDSPFTTNLLKATGITVNTVTGNIETIKFFKDRYQPDIETMEGAAIAYTCLMENVPYIQIRSVSNKVEPRNKKNWNISLAIKNLTSTLIDIFTSSNFFNLI